MSFSMSEHGEAHGTETSLFLTPTGLMKIAFRYKGRAIVLVMDPHRVKFEQYADDVLVDEGAVGAELHDVMSWLSGSFLDGEKSV